MYPYSFNVSLQFKYILTVSKYPYSYFQINDLRNMISEANFCVRFFLKQLQVNNEIAS